MGFLYKVAMQKWQRKHILDELKKFNVTHTAAGEPITTLDYDRLKEELVLACFRFIDYESDEGKWF